MTKVALAARLFVLLAALSIAAPVQILANRLKWPIARRLPVAFHRLFLRLFDIRVTILGQPPEHGRPTLVLANHVSWLDIPIMSSTLPMSFIAKHEIASWPLFGPLAKLQRCVFLDRSRKSATAEVNDVVGQRLAEGDVIVLFPEGTTGDGRRLLPFRSSLVGAARVALVDSTAESIDLQPLAIVYLRRNGLVLNRREMPQVAWYGDMDLVPHLAGFVWGGPLDVAVVWGTPISFDAASNRKRITALAEDRVRRAVRQAKAGAVAESLFS